MVIWNEILITSKNLKANIEIFEINVLENESYLNQNWYKSQNSMLKKRICHLWPPNNIFEIFGTCTVFCRFKGKVCDD